MIRAWLPAAMLAVTALLALLLALPANGVAHDRPHKKWLESLQRPDNDRNPWRQSDRKSLFCCGEATSSGRSSKSRYRRPVPRGSMVRMARPVRGRSSHQKKSWRSTPRTEKLFSFYSPAPSSASSDPKAACKSRRRKRGDRHQCSLNSQAGDRHETCMHEDLHAGNFCIWPRALPRCRPCRASPGRKPIPINRCDGSSALRRPVRATSRRGSWGAGWRNGWAGPSLSKTSPEPAVTSRLIAHRPSGGWTHAAAGVARPGDQCDAL